MKKVILIFALAAFIFNGSVFVNQVMASDNGISVYDDPPKKDADKKDKTCTDAKVKENCKPSDCTKHGSKATCCDKKGTVSKSSCCDKKSPSTTKTDKPAEETKTTVDPGKK